MTIRAHMLRTTILAACALARCTACMPADEPPARWPSLRGPNHDAHVAETGLIEEFPPEGPPVLWTRPLGPGYSGFVGEGGRVYTQYQSLGGQYVACLDAESGGTVWEHRYDAPYDPAGLYPGPRGTPALGGGRVYYTTPAGVVGCLTADTGRPVWSLDLFGHFGVGPIDFGYSCSSTFAGDKLLLPVGPPGAAMVALDATTGELLWQAGDDPASHVPALPITWRGERLVIGYLRNVLVAHELGTGRLRWRKAVSSGYDEHAAWPAYSEPYLWVSGAFRGGSELIELTGEPPGYRTVWKERVLSNDVCSSVLIDGHLYGFDLHDVQSKAHRPSRGQFRCVELLTGRVRWSNGSLTERRRFDDEEGSTSIGQATVLYADGKLILFNELGELILARPDPERYVELGRVRVLGGELCWTQPTLLRGRLYVRNHTRAACLLLGRTESFERAETGGLLTVSDIPQSRYRDWAAVLLPVEPEYAMDPPTAAELRLWYVISMIILGIAAAVPGLGLAAVSLARRLLVRSRGESDEASGTRPDDSKPHLSLPRATFRRAYRALLVLFGVAGTTAASVWLDRFVFTWPLALFAAFEATADRARPRGDRRADGVWPGRMVLAGFVLACLGYFLVCRRLGLSFEWTFLAGFPAAVPFLLLGRRSARPGWRPCAAELALSAAAFTAYYWASAGYMLWRYGR